MKILDIPRSGSYQGLTSSHNRYGQYVRTRAIPVNPRTTYQSLVRARLANLAQNWRQITSAQRAGWSTLGGYMTRSDSLGQAYNLTGLQAYLSVNGNNDVAGGTIVADAPALVEPDPLLTITVTLTAVAFSWAYTTTPLIAGAKLLAFCSPQGSAGKAFQGDYRLILVSSAAAASPLLLTTAYTARLGVPVVGNRIFGSAVIYAGGFVSKPLLWSQVVA